MKIVEVPVTDEADAMSDDTVTNVSIRFFNISYAIQTDSLVRVEQIRNMEIPLFDSNLSHVTSLSASFYTFGLDFFGSTSVSEHLPWCES